MLRREYQIHTNPAKYFGYHKRDVQSTYIRRTEPQSKFRRWRGKKRDGPHPTPDRKRVKESHPAGVLHRSTYTPIVRRKPQPKFKSDWLRGGSASKRTTDYTRGETLARYRYANLREPKGKHYQQMTMKHIRYKETQERFRRRALTGTAIASSPAGVYLAGKESQTTEHIMKARKHKAKAQSIRLKARGKSRVAGSMRKRRGSK